MILLIKRNANVSSEEQVYFQTYFIALYFFRIVNTNSRFLFNLIIREDWIY